jgi:MarR family transcriptional regulator, organic hydroperoxide resistance regulator
MTTVPARPLASALDTDPREQLGHAFKATMVAVRRLRGREAQGLGKLSYAQYSLLGSLSAEPELSASQLAAIADLSPATVTQMLDHLESDGLVTRVRSQLDKRVVLVALTSSGRKLVEERRARFEPRWQAALAEFSDAELLTAAAVLDRLRELFDEIDGD